MAANIVVRNVDTLVSRGLNIQHRFNMPDYLRFRAFSLLRNKPNQLTLTYGDKYPIQKQSRYSKCGEKNAMKTMWLIMKS